MTIKPKQLTFLAFYINSAIDTGHFDYLSVSDVKARVQDGSIIDFLNRELGEHFDSSLLSESDMQELVAEWQDILNAVNEGRKMGVYNRGLPLIAAYLVESIQRRV